MGLIYRVACLLGWHKWWDAGEGDLVCLECGLVTNDQPALTRVVEPDTRVPTT